MAKKSKSITRPRPEAITAEEVERRLEVIREAIITGSNGDTVEARRAQNRTWAEEWGITESTVRNYTASAWREIRRASDSLFVEVMETSREVLLNGKDEHRLKAAERISKICGFDAAQKLELDSSEMRSDQRKRVRAWLMNPDAELIGLLGEALKAKESKLPEVLKQLGMYRRKVVEG